MTPKQLITRFRNKVGDHQKTKYTDYQLLQEYNNALQQIENELHSRFNQYLLTTATIEFNNQQAALPDDFASLYEIPLIHSRADYDDTGFDVRDNIIYAPVEDGEITITYYRTIPSIESLDDESPLPSIFDIVILDLILSAFGLPNTLEQSVENLRYTVANQTYNKILSSVPKWRY